MTTELFHAICVRPIIPDGVFYGLWTGYAVRFETPIGLCEAATTVGVRGINVRCEVRSVDRKLSVTVKDDQ